MSIDVAVNSITQERAGSVRVFVFLVPGIGSPGASEQDAEVPVVQADARRLQHLPRLGSVLENLVHVVQDLEPVQLLRHGRVLLRGFHDFGQRLGTTLKYMDTKMKGVQLASFGEMMESIDGSLLSLSEGSVIYPSF